MKYFWPLIILFSFSCHISKKLRGNYFESFHGFGGANWHFNKDGTFNVEGHAETDHYFGNGNYRIKSDSIHLIYRDVLPKDSLSSTIEIVTQPDSENEIKKIKVEVTDDSTKEAIPFAVVVAKDSSGKNLAGIATDINGIGVLLIDNYKGSLIISVKFVAYKMASCKLPKPYDCTLKVRLDANDREEIGAHTDSYKFRKTPMHKMIFQTTFTDSEVVEKKLKIFKPYDYIKISKHNYRHVLVKKKSK